MYFEDEAGRMYYEIHGPHKAPTVVFSHGVSMDHQTFASQVNSLCKHYRVIVWDMPYHGLSSGIDFSLQFSDVAADFILKILDSNDVDRAVLVGQSLGSFVAQHGVRKYPDRVMGTVHIGGAPLYPGYCSLLRILNPFIAASIHLWPQRFLYRSFARHKALKDETRDYLAEASARTGKKVIIHLTQEMLRDMVKGIPEPTKEQKLLCYGEHDLRFIKVLSQKWQSADSKSQLVEIADAHHIANQDNPDEFNKILLSFLERVF